MSPLLGGIEEVRKGTSGRQGTDPGLKRRRGERDKPISVKSEKKTANGGKTSLCHYFQERSERERQRRKRERKEKETKRRAGVGLE